MLIFSYVANSIGLVMVSFILIVSFFICRFRLKILIFFKTLSVTDRISSVNVVVTLFGSIISLLATFSVFYLGYSFTTINNSTQFETYFKLAKSSLESEDYNKAVEYFEKSIAYININDYDRLILIYSGLGNSYSSLGLINFDTNLIDRGISNYKIVLDLYKLHDSYDTNYASLLLDTSTAYSYRFYVDPDTGTLSEWGKIFDDDKYVIIDKLTFNDTDIRSQFLYQYGIFNYYTYLASLNVNSEFRTVYHVGDITHNSALCIHLLRAKDFLDGDTPLIDGIKYSNINTFALVHSRVYLALYDNGCIPDVDKRDIEFGNFFNNNNDDEVNIKTNYLNQASQYSMFNLTYGKKDVENNLRFKLIQSEILFRTYKEDRDYPFLNSAIIGTLEKYYKCTACKIDKILISEARIALARYRLELILDSGIITLPGAHVDVEYIKELLMPLIDSPRLQTKKEAVYILDRMYNYLSIRNGDTYDKYEVEHLKIIKYLDEFNLYTSIFPEDL